MTKKERKKLTRDTWMDIVNIVMVVVSCILYAILIYARVVVSRQYTIVTSAMNDYITSVENATKVSDASSYLTDQTHHYVIDFEPEHIENYFTEVHVTRRRENALLNLADFADKKAISALQEALYDSNELIDIEIYAMRLAAESQGGDISDFPQEIREVQLTAEDQNLSAEEKHSKAMTMVFGESYHQNKEEITGKITEFLDDVIGGTRQKQQESMTEMREIMVVQTALLIALIVQSLITLTMIILNNRKKQKENKIFINQIIHAFAKSIDIKDKYTNGHSLRVAKYARMIAKKAGFSDKEAEAVYNIGLLHDIGKITVPDGILNKPGHLDDDEFSVIQKHTSNGSEILKEIAIAPELAIGAQYHHERIDGRGYPYGKSGDQIPEIAQIIAVADTFDAMYSTRPYRKQMPIEKVIAELERCAGTQLNEEYVKLLIQLIHEDAVTDVNNIQ